MYGHSFTITDPVSNNSFGFNERKTENGSHPHLHIASIKEGSPNDLAVGDKTVFEDYEDGKLKSCKGLKYFIKTAYEKSKAPVYIFDNHNHAFYFWHHERNNGILPQGIPLIHIDQHKDTRQPTSYLSEHDSYNDETLFQYTNTILNVGNFIPPAIKTGLISEIINIDSEQSLNRATRKIPGSFILDIDVDFFAPELEYIPDNMKIATINQLLPLAKLITVATSPFFIDQQKAIQLIHEIFS